MLQFWKKNGKKGKTDNRSSSIHAPKPSHSSLSNGDSNYVAGPHSIDSPSTNSCGELADIDDAKWVSCHRSQLSKSLREILSHRGALGYFIQYLEARGLQSLVKFWLETESFRIASATKPSSLQAQVIPITREELERTNDAPRSSPQHSQRSLGTDCDSVFESPTRSIDSEENISDISHPVSTEFPINNTLKKSLPISTRSNENIVEDCNKTTFVIESNDQVKCDIRNTVIGSSSFKRDNSDNCRTQNYSLSAQPEELSSRDNDLRVPSLNNLDDLSTASRQSLSVKSSVSSQSRSCGNFLQSLLDEAVRIFRKYLATSSAHRIQLDADVKERIVQAICRDDGAVDPGIFTEAQEIIFHRMNNEHYNSFLLSDFHCKHQIDVLTSGRVSMADILYNETALFYFTEYMEQEGNTSLVQFWLAAVNFQQHLQSQEGSYDAIVAQNDAMILYDKYFSMQATCPLGFNNQVRLGVEQNICREEGPLPDCFQRPIDMVQYLLEKSFLSSFLSSQLNMKYLTELVNAIQASPGLLTKHRKTASESSSEWSISAQNTLLASEDGMTHPNKALRKVTAGEMCIDSRQLNDPDALWRRHRKNGLSFGRINKMGRFETDVEPEPDRKEESRLAKAVKKLVNMEEDKAKEEMAWQIAEMIVKDITSLTLGNSEQS